MSAERAEELVKELTIPGRYEPTVEQILALAAKDVLR